MQPEQTASQVSWTDLSGTILPGGYELKELIEADGDAAQFRVRVLGDRELDAVAQFVHVGAEETARLVAGWELIRSLRHPNLTAPLGAGSWDRDGSELAYLVSRRADEAMDGVLQDRPLSAGETTEVFLSAAHGLEALHANGLVHGCLSPEQVLAVGDAIQLPVTCIREVGRGPELALVNPKYLAPESLDEDGEDGENVTPEADVWCLGTTIFEALTQKDWTEESREATEALPEPFATVARRCLEEDPKARCTLAEAVGLLKGEIKPAARARAAAAGAGAEGMARTVPISLVPAVTPAPAPAVPPAPAAAVPAAAPAESPLEPAVARSEEAIEPLTTPTPPPEPPPPPMPNPPPAAKPGLRRVTMPVVNESLSKPRVVRAMPAESAEGKSGGSSARLWMWAGVALVFVLGMVWALRPKTQVPSAAIATTPTAPVPGTSKANVPAAGDTKVLQPDGTATNKVTAPNAPLAAPRTEADTKPVAPSALVRRDSGHKANGDIWRVVLYTYNRRADAEHKSEQINQRHASLHTEVFTPNEGGGPFLVTIKGGERDEANQLKRRAVGNGMPHDSYIQNYSR